MTAPHTFAGFLVYAAVVITIGALISLAIYDVTVRRGWDRRPDENFARSRDALRRASGRCR